MINELSHYEGRLLFSLVTAMIFFSICTVAQTDNGNECSCFKTNGSSSTYFTYHRFHDFRNVSSSLAIVPEVLIDADNTTNADASSAFFRTKAWTSDWTIQAWNNSEVMGGNGATALMINSPNNVYVENSIDSSTSYKTYLTLRTTRTPDFQSAAEFDSTEQNFQYLSARFLARVIGSPGACAGIFTYLASSPVQEADIEILTSGPRNVVQYTNQPSNSPSGDILPDATVNGSIPGGLDWSTWNTYRLDWTPTQSSWYVNGYSAANISFQVPRDPAGLMVNMWSDGGVWTGNMSVHDAAFLQLQWIEVVYNTSGPYAGAANGTGPRQATETGSTDGKNGCKVVCSIDEGINSSSVGTPVVLYNNTGAASSFRQPGHWSGWVPGLLLAGLVSAALYF